MADFHPRMMESVDLIIVGQKGNEQNAGMLAEQMAIKLHLEGSIPHVTNQALCQVIWAKGPENTYDIFVGYVVADVKGFPEGTDAYHLRSETIAAFDHRGDTKSLRNLVSSLYTDWLPHAGYSVNHADFTHILFVKQSEETDHLLPLEKRIFDWEVWIPIK